MNFFNNVFKFNWDPGKLNKNYLLHNVLWVECEEIFFNEPLIAADDIKHSENEKRYYGLGKTNSKRKLFIVFTIRNNKIRIISARDMNKKEKKKYEKYKNKENP